MMQGVCRELGFEIGSEPEGLIHAVLNL